MKKIEIEVPDGKDAKWVDGVLTLVDKAPKDITGYIETFGDARAWCCLNNYGYLIRQYDEIKEVLERKNLTDGSEDILAHLKLRIITIALNEGWKPTFDGDEQRWYVYYHIEDGLPSVGSERLTFDLQKPASLLFKSERLAKYAAAQFYDIYSDFCGYEEGGEK